MSAVETFCLNRTQAQEFLEVYQVRQLLHGVFLFIPPVKGGQLKVFETDR